MRYLVAIPVFNEARTLLTVLRLVQAYARDILVVDDGSTDRTPQIMRAEKGVFRIRHPDNRGYGQSLSDAFRFAICREYDWLITMDCDEQHEPESIPDFLNAIREDDADVISGSRYLQVHPENDRPPSDRRKINAEITQELNERLGLQLTDGFCGFKAYRVAALEKMELDVNGYEFPMQFWVQAVAHHLRIRELPIRLIYNDPTRSFGGPLDNPQARIEHYRQTLHREIARCVELLPPHAADGLEIARSASSPGKKEPVEATASAARTKCCWCP